MQTKKRSNKKGALAITQILILIVGIVAISYAIGSGMGVVSGETYNSEQECKDHCFSKVIGNLWYYGMCVQRDNKWECVNEGKITSARQCLSNNPDPNNPTRAYFYDGECHTTEKVSSPTGKSYPTCKGADGTNGVCHPQCIHPLTEFIGFLSQNCPSDKECCVPKSEIPLEGGAHLTVPGGAGAVEKIVGGLSGDDLAKEITKNAFKWAGDDYSSANGKWWVNIDGTWQMLDEADEGNKTLISSLNEAFPQKIPTKEDYPKFFGKDIGYFLGHIWEGLYWAGIVYGAIQTFEKLGVDTRITDAASKAAAVGIMTGKFFKAIGLKGNLKGIGYPVLLGMGAAIVTFFLTYEDEKYETVQFTCYPWEAPTGGKKCEECNKQGILPCSPYQCRSLGQACELVNEGTDEEKCVWVNRNDVEYPIIQPWKNALSSGYIYKPDNKISPPERGVEIVNSSYPNDPIKKCVAPFTPLSFGVTLNEPGKCKIDYIRKAGFDEMSYYFGGSQLFKYNHTQTMSLPGAEALAAENITLENDNEYELSVRCQDKNGNYNKANFVFKFCVDEGPDTTPPLIVTTDLLNNMPVAYNQSSVDIEVYINEPLATRQGGCRWSHLDMAYEKMEEDMTCATSVMEFNAQMLYKCSTTLTGIKNRVENNFYFRCMDKAGNKNEESYEFSLIGTQPLVIDWVKPNETVKDSTDFVKVELEARTSAGYKEGEATCYFSETGEENDYVEFYNTNSYQHSQDIYREEGEYTYYIKCVDLGGNQDLEQTTFWVESDSESPVVVRAYHEDTYLKLITDESATCVYDTVDCSYVFDDGISMTTVDDTHHYTDWNTETTLYVKCQDDYGNQPFPNECSIIVRGVEN